MSNKTSCIQHPARAMLVLIREEYVAICNGDHCAAALLAYFEHWTNSKLDALQQHEVEKSIASKEGVELPPADLWVYASIEQISFDLLGLYAKRKLSEALDYLCEVGFLSRRNNPIYKWDRTTQYQFEFTIVQHAIGEMDTLHSAKRGNVKVQKGEMNDAKKGQAIPKIHTEIPIEKDIAANAAIAKIVPEYLTPVFKAVVIHVFKLNDFSTLSESDIKRYRALAQIARMKAGGAAKPATEIAQLIQAFVVDCEEKGYTPPQAQTKFSSGFDAYLQNRKPAAPLPVVSAPDAPDMTPTFVPAYMSQNGSNDHD